MSQEITEAFVKQYTSNVFHLSQQRGTRLRPFVRQEMQRGKDAYYDRIGLTAAQKRLGRHSDTPLIDTPHSRRRVSLADYELADLVDNQDKIRTLIDPTSAYAQSFAWAMGRSIDDELIDASVGVAHAGEEGNDEVEHPLSQKFAAMDGASASNLNLDALRRAKRLFDQNDVDESIPRYIAVTSRQIESLLDEEELTSADYNTVKTLVQGEIDTFMGFRFVRLERIPHIGAGEFNIAGGNGDEDAGTAVETGTGDSFDADGLRRCFAWAGDGLLLAVGQNPVGRISDRDDKSYSTQVYMSMSIGATRLEDEKVVEILCNED